MEARLEDVIRAWREALRSGYPALVTAVAGFLLVLLIWPPARRTYVAEATALADSPQGPLVAADDVETWLQSDEVLRAAIANLRTADPRSLAALQEPSAAQEPVSALRQHLHLARLASPDEMPRLAIGCDAPQRRAALALADELAKQLAEHYAAQRRHDRLDRFHERQRQVSQELKDAHAAQERLEVELEGLRHAQLTSALAASTYQTSAASPATIGAATDPRGSELKRSLESLKTERDRLLEVYSPAHPQIQTLSAQISRLEEALRHHAPDPEDSSSLGPRVREASAGGSRVVMEWRRQPAETLASGQETIHAADGPGAELVAAIRKTQIEMLTVTNRRQQAEQVRQALETEQKQIESETEFAWTAQPAQIVEVTGGAQARQQLAAAFLVAVMGGLAVAWGSRLAARNRSLASAAELRSSISLPVLGTLSSGEEEVELSTPPSRAKAAVQFATRCAEVILVTFVLTFLAAVALDRGLWTDFLHDPLAALGELVQRLL